MGIYEGARYRNLGIEEFRMLGACITYIKSVLALLQFAAFQKGRVQLDSFAKLASLHFNATTLL